jgi:hypothetical protein
MIRRHPDAIVAAHCMDRSRRELYVEGSRDRLFLAWLLAGKMNPDASIREIALVELPDTLPGGERCRLIRFAELLGERGVRIRMFADADWDRLLRRSVPERVWLTDHRDMEGYVLREECVDKVLRLGVGTNRLSAVNLLRVIREHGRRLGCTRLLSERDSLRLPFQATRLKRYLSGDGDRILLDLEGYLQALLQNANISLARFDEIRGRLGEVEAEYASSPDSEVIHGKDAICILESALACFRLKPEDGARLLWTSFEAAFVEEGSTLDMVTRFLRESSVLPKLL